MESIINEITNGALTLMVALISLAMVYLTKWINVKTKNAYLQGVMDRLTDLVNVVVKDVKQTTVEAMKKAAEDGKLTQAEMTEVLNESIILLRSYLGPKGLTELIKIFGARQTDNLLKSKIEQMVHDVNLSIRMEYTK